MRRKTVVITDAARRDIDDKYEWIADRADEEVARRYTDKVKDACKRLALAPTQGRKRDDVEPGLRVTGFDRHHNICFIAVGDEIKVLRVLFNGRDISRAFGRH